MKKIGTLRAGVDIMGLCVDVGCGVSDWRNDTRMLRAIGKASKRVEGASPSTPPHQHIIVYEKGRERK